MCACGEEVTEKDMEKQKYIDDLLLEARKHNVSLETVAKEICSLFEGCPAESKRWKPNAGEEFCLFLLSLNLLAFLFHTVLEWGDDKYARLRQVLARRQTFFHDIQALMRYMVFDHWDHLMDFMIRGLDLESQCDTS